MGGPTLDRFEQGPHGAGGRSAGLRPTLLALVALSACAPTGAMAATDLEAQAAALTLTQAVAIPAGWTGRTDTCDAGTESAASREATLQAVNAFRSVAGVPPVALDAAMNDKALAAALMMRAGNDVQPARGLSHAPDPSWPCFTPAGAEGAGTSNLALGSSGADAIRLYVDDERVDSLGHRRWILDPGLTVVGTGSTGSTNALTVIGGPRQSVPAGRQVAWPPAGAIAASWLPETWSISIGGTGDAVNLVNPAVTMALNGAPVDVPAGSVRDLGGGFGTGRSLAWTPMLDAAALRSGSHQLSVSIGGATINGAPTPIAYTVTLGPLPTPTPAPMPAPAPAPTPMAKVLAGLQPRILRPRGRLRVGSRLTATFAQNTGRITTKLQWLRSGRPINGATSIHHRVGRKDLGRTLRIRVTSQARDGTSPTTELSARVKIPR